MDPNRSKQRDEIIRIPSNNLLLAQNVIKTACSRCNWFCFSLDKKLAGDLLANRYVWQSQSRNYSHLKTALTAMTISYLQK